MHSAAWLPTAVAILLALALPAAPAQAGSLDPGFGTGGLATFLGPDSFIYAIEAQSTGKIVAAGRQGNQWAIARLDLNGALDTTSGICFGPNPAELFIGGAALSPSQFTVAKFVR